MLLVEATTATSHIEVEVRAASTSTSSPTATASEEVREDVIKVHVMELLATSRLPVTLLVLPDTLLALLIVDASLLLVRENLVSVGDLLEFFLGRLRVVLILIRVVLDCEFLECLFDLSFSGVALHSYNFIEVFTCGLLFLAATLG